MRTEEGRTLIADFIHSILSPNAVVAADGDEITDLPVNPLSVVLINISPLNETSTITNYSLLEALLSAVDNVEISHKGASVINASGTDLAAMAMLYHRAQIWQSNAVDLDNDRRSIILPIFLSKQPFMLNECFPATTRGELQLTITWDIADTGFDGLRRSIETIELPGATPTVVQKVTTLSQTFLATGQNDINLPIGNFLRAVLLFGTTAFAGATPTPTLGQLSFLVNNLQIGFSATDFEVLRGMHGLFGLTFPPDFRHVHNPAFDVVAADATDLATVITLANEIKADLNALTATQEPEVGASLDDNYVLLDFDPARDDQFGIDTEGASSVRVRSDAEVANAVRALPIERVPIERFLG